MLTPDRLEIYRDYYQHERQAEVAAARLAAQTRPGGGAEGTGIAPGQRTTWPDWTNLRARAAALRATLVGRLPARMAATWTAGVVLAVALGLVSMALSGAPAVASACPAPGTDLPGALNMRAGGDGMALAMNVDNQNGNDGMLTAVVNSGC